MLVRLTDCHKAQLPQKISDTPSRDAQIMSETQSQDSQGFLSIPSHMKDRGWQLGMLFSVPTFAASLIVWFLLPEWQAFASFFVAVFVTYAAAYTGYRIGSRDATDDRRG